MRTNSGWVRTLYFIKRPKQAAVFCRKRTYSRVIGSIIYYIVHGEIQFIHSPAKCQRTREKHFLFKQKRLVEKSPPIIAIAILYQYQPFTRSTITIERTCSVYTNTPFGLPSRTEGKKAFKRLVSIIYTSEKNFWPNHQENQKWK